MKRLFNLSVISLLAAFIMALPVYAGGYISTEKDYLVNMTKEDISFKEALDRVVEKDDESTGEVSIFNADYTPRETIPSKYPASDGDLDDLRQYLEDTFPANRDQASFGSCWAHAAMALSEFYEVKNGGKEKTIDLSEDHLAYGAFKTRPNLRVGNDEDLGEVNFSGSDKSILDYGGNLDMAAQFLSKEFGYVNEEVFPYISSKTSAEFDGSGNLIDSDKWDALYTTHENNTVHLTNMYRIDIKTENGAKIAKEAIMQNGIIGASYRNRRSTCYYQTGNAYFNNSDTSQDHAICIVGWDDDFAVSNFNPSKKPENPGAWLIRNSWGSDGNDLFSYEKYFWLSYEDKSLAKAAYIYEVTEDPGFDNNYYYDTQIHNTGASYNSGQKSKCANVFKVPEDSNEILTEVTFETDRATDYSVEIYVNPENGADPESGNNIKNAKVEGKLSFPGLYTVSLNEAVELSGGDSFAVVLTADATACYELTCSTYYSVSGLKAGQSYIYDNGKWVDFKEMASSKKGNFCISAHTVNSTIQKETLTADDFTFTPPAALYYDEKPHEASVSAKEKDTGVIQVYYEYTVGGNTYWSEEAPVDPGTYRVMINVASNDTYASAKELRGDNWIFTIKEKSGDSGKGGSEEGGKGSEEGGGGSEEGGNSSEEGGSGSEEGGSGSEEGGSGSEEGGSGSGEGGSGSEESGSGTGEGGSGSPVSGNGIKSVSFKNTNGGTETLYYDVESGTYETKNGQEVLVYSLDNGKKTGEQKYQYTGKKITPGKNSHVVYKGVIYDYKRDYTVSFKNNKKPGQARSVIKWKKSAEPYNEGKKVTLYFSIKPRSVSADMVSLTLNPENGSIKKLTVSVANGVMVKLKKNRDYSYSFDGTEYVIVFKNYFTGTVSKRLW